MKRTIDPENPPITSEEMRDMRPLSEAFGGELVAAMRRRRGKQRTPTKRSVTLRLSAEVLDAFKSAGHGWQTRINETLLQYLHRVQTRQVFTATKAGGAEHHEVRGFKVSASMGQLRRTVRKLKKRAAKRGR